MDILPSEKVTSLSIQQLNQHESCWGCKTCEMACKQENQAPDGVRLISACADNACLAYCIHFGDSEEIGQTLLQQK